MSKFEKLGKIIDFWLIVLYSSIIKLFSGVNILKMKKSLENLYKIVQYSILLNDENLKSSGYDELDIKNMLDDNILVKEDNAYRFNDVNGLYQYVYINDLKKISKSELF